MDNRRSNGARGTGDHSSRRRPARDEYVGSRRRRGGYRTSIYAGAGLGILLLLVLGVGAVWFVTAKHGASKQSAAASSTASAVAKPAAVGSSAAAQASGSPAAASSAAASSSASTDPSTAWRNADPSWMDKYKGKHIYGFKPEPGYKAVALTFDDGPNGETKYVINTLKQYNGQGTFFDTGRKLAMSWAKSQPSIIWDAGFEFANHTQHHTLPDGISSMWHRSYATDLAEINGPDVYAKRGTGRNTVWLRPMGGMIDATGIKAAADTNHLVIEWTVDSNDSHGGPRTPDYLYTQCTTNIKSGDVILLHVTHPESMQALPRICAELTRQGFKLVTLSELAQHSTAPIIGKIKK